MYVGGSAGTKVTTLLLTYIDLTHSRNINLIACEGNLREGYLLWRGGFKTKYIFFGVLKPHVPDPLKSPSKRFTT